MEARVLRRAVLSLLPLASIPSVSHATVYFQNTGTLSGWDSSIPQHLGTITQVSSPTYEGTTALRFTQTYDASYAGRYHSEVMKRDVGQRGWGRYYSYVFRLDGNWEFANNGASLSQMGYDYCGKALPTFMEAVENTSLYVHVRTGDPCSPTLTKTAVVGSVSRGVWHRIVSNIQFRSDVTGQYQVYYDGTRVYARLNQPNLPATDSLLRWSLGLYMGTWARDARGFQGTQTTKTSFTDHVRISTHWAEADPAQW